MAEVWARIEGESMRAYEAFRAFRELPAKDRTAERAAEEVGAPVSTARKWLTKYRWHERADAWSDRTHAIEDEARLTKLRQMHEDHLRYGKVAQMKAIQALSALRPDQIPAGAAIRLLDLGVRIERNTLTVTPEDLLGQKAPEAQEDPFDEIGRILAETG